MTIALYTTATCDESSGLTMILGSVLRCSPPAPHEAHQRGPGVGWPPARPNTEHVEPAATANNRALRVMGRPLSDAGPLSPPAASDPHPAPPVPRRGLLLVPLSPRLLDHSHHLLRQLVRDRD